jgi:hypothetical protein
MEEMVLLVGQECFCEHCGELEEFSVVFDDGGCTWCLDCARNDGEFREHITEEDIDKAIKESYLAKIKYFEGRIKWLKHVVETNWGGDDSE